MNGQKKGVVFEPNSFGNGGRIVNSYAKVGLVLFSEEEQQIIFVALGMYDGGGAYVEELNFFFNKFGIDPQEYEKRSTPGYGGGK